MVVVSLPNFFKMLGTYCLFKTLHNMFSIILDYTLLKRLHLKFRLKYQEPQALSVSRYKILIDQKAKKYHYLFFMFIYRPLIC